MQSGGTPLPSWLISQLEMSRLKGLSEPSTTHGRGMAVHVGDDDFF